MADFAYTAVDANGRAVRGMVAAAHRNAAIDQLAGAGVFVTEIAEKRKSSGGKGVRLPFMPVVSTNELVLFIRRLATLVGSDIPLVKCMDALCERVDSEAFAEVLKQVRHDVQHGQTFSRALSAHPKVFPELMVAMVRVGETGGILSIVLEQLAQFTERDREIRGEVRMALAYPVVILTFALLLIVYLMTRVVPKLVALFADMEGALPLPTQILIGMSNFISGHFILLLLGSAALVSGVVFWVRRPSGQALFDRYKLAIPLIGSLMTRSAVARFTRSLGALDSGGVPLMEALDVVKDILNNRTMSESVERMKESLRRGESLAQGMTREAVFPSMVSSMVAAGEESGHLSDMLFKIAEVYEMETRNTVRVVISLLSPILILFVAGFVLFLAMAMLLPIFQINQLVK